MYAKIQDWYLMLNVYFHLELILLGLPGLN